MCVALRWPAATLVLAAAVLVACSNAGPRVIVAGQDACDFCRMTISDLRFGGEVVTSTGRTRVFDSVECLAGFAAARGDSLSAQDIWVADFTSSTLVPAADAHFLVGSSLHSPMARQVASFSARTDAKALVARYGGTILTWSGIVARERSHALAPTHGSETDAPVPAR